MYKGGSNAVCRFLITYVMHSQIDLQVKCISNRSISVSAWCYLRLNLLIIFLNDLTNCFDETCIPVLIGEH